MQQTPQEHIDMSSYFYDLLTYLCMSELQEHETKYWTQAEAGLLDDMSIVSTQLQAMYGKDTWMHVIYP